jgi:hypothetical protein
MQGSRPVWVINSRQTMTASAATFFGSSRRGTLRTDSPAKVVAGRYGIVDDSLRGAELKTCATNLLH